MSINRRLLFLFLIVVLIPMGVTAVLMSTVLTSTLEDKARSSLDVDLKWAWSVIRQRLESLQQTTQPVTAVREVLSMVSLPESERTAALRGAVRSELEDLKEGQRSSFVVLLDANGEVLARANSSTYGDDYTALKIITPALAGEPAQGFEFLGEDVIEKEDLTQAAQVPLETPSEFLRKGLALVAAVPVKVGSTVQGVLLTGELLNNNTSIPDLVGTPTGHVLAVWLQDTCVATNALRQDGKRALGEKLRLLSSADNTDGGDAEIVLAGQSQRVLLSYIRDSANQIKGMLHVGIPQSEIVAHRRRALLIIGLTSLVGAVFAVFLSVRLSAGITRPIAEMVAVTRQVADGDLSAQVPVYRNDEVGELAQSLNHMIRDLSGAQEKLIRSQRLAAIGQLAGSISHELRNPLSVLRSSAYYLRSKLANVDSKVQKHLGIIEEEIGNSDRLIADLLDFSRTKPPTLQRTYLNYVVEEALARIEVPAGVTVKMEVSEGLPAIRADNYQLEQVFVNLLNNAVQAMPKGGTLTVSTWHEGDNQYARVDDTGVGIKREHMDNIFEPLFTTKARGIGLGLAVCRTLVENHGGSITVESTEGEGTSFTLGLATNPGPVRTLTSDAEEEMAEEAA